MTTYRHILLVIFFFCSSIIAAVAQQYTFRLDTVLYTAKNPTYGKLRVVDLRTQKNDIGELNTGAFNRVKPIVTDMLLSDMLSSYYSRIVW